MATVSTLSIAVSSSDQNVTGYVIVNHSRHAMSNRRFFTSSQVTRGLSCLHTSPLDVLGNGAILRSRICSLTLQRTADLSPQAWCSYLSSAGRMKQHMPKLAKALGGEGLSLLHLQLLLFFAGSCDVAHRVGEKH